MPTPTGRIKIEGDAKEFNRAVKDIVADMNEMEEVAKETSKNISTSVRESFATTANNTLELFSKAKDFLVGIKDHLVNNMKLAADVERGDVAWKMLRRQNEELYQAAQLSMDYSLGLLKVRDSVFVINDVLGKGIKLNKKLYQDLIQQATLASIRLNKPIETMIEQISDMGVKMEGNSEEMKKLGIQIDKDAVFLRFAEQTGKAVEELTEAEKKTAFLSELLDKLAGKSKVSFEEASGLTSITQAYEKYTDTMTDLEERYANKVAEVGVMINKWFNDKDNLRKLDVVAEQKTIYHIGGLLDTATEQQKASYKKLYSYTKENILNQLKEKAIYEEKTKALKIAIRDLEAESKQLNFTTEQMDARFTALFKTFGGGGISLDKIKNMFALIRKEQDELKKAQADEEQAQIDKANEDKRKKERDKRLQAYKTEKEKEIQIALGFYDKLKEQEFKTYEEKEAFEQAKLDMTKKFKTMDINQLKAYQKKADEVLFNRNKNKEELEKQNQDMIDFINKQESDYKAYTEAMANLDAQLLEDKKLLASKIEKMSDARTIQDLDASYQAELERFKKYAEERKLSEQDLALGIEDIKRRSAEKQAQIEEQSVTMQQRIREMGNNLYVASMNKMYDVVTKGQITSFQELLPFIMQQAGSILWIEGTKNIGISIGLTANPFTAWAGPKLFAAGLAQIALGGTLGYAGNAMSSSSTSSSSAGIENRQAEIDYSVDQRTAVYMYPSEKEYLSNLKKSMKKIGA